MNVEEAVAGLPKSANPELVLDWAGVTAVLPHRHPFLFVDGLVSLTPEKSATGMKNFSFGDPFFLGHFPDEPVVPGVVQIEALAQVATILVALSFPEAKGKRPAFAGIDGARFRKAVRPGDTMLLHVELEKYRRNFAVLKGRAEVRGEISAEAILMATMI